MGNEIITDDIIRSSTPQASTHFFSHPLTIIRIVVLLLIVLYICKYLQTSDNLLVNLFFWKTKGTRRRQSQYSFLNNFFGTGDPIKDMQTIKNTIINAKV